MPRVRTHAWAIALLTVTPAGCARSPSGGAAPTASSAASPSPAPASSPPATAQADDLIGKQAPDFTATAQDGAPLHLAALKGKPVVVYFYPKDETPGCTREACSFRDSWKPIAATGAVLVGVSADSAESHKAFAAHHGLPFLLVSDPDGAIGKSYGVPFTGVHKRQTVVIGPDGVVRKVYRSVNVAVHAEQVLGDLQAT